MAKPIRSARGRSRASPASTFEQGVAQRVHVFTLYVAGLGEVSRRAVENVRKVCEARLHGRFTLDVVDVYQHPDIAKRDDIVALPSLVRSSPAPRRVLIGDMSNLQHVLIGLQLPEP